MTEIDTFLDRDRPGRERANELARMWAESDRRFRMRRRLQLNAERYAYHLHLCDVFRRMGDEHGAKAAQLLEDEPKGAP